VTTVLKIIGWLSIAAGVISLLDQLWALGAGGVVSGVTFLAAARAIELLADISRKLDAPHDRVGVAEK
jgi:predicted anti-sigma-YlaC factor YlaD